MIPLVTGIVVILLWIMSRPMIMIVPLVIIIAMSPWTMEDIDNDIDVDDDDVVVVSPPDTDEHF